MWHPQLSWAVCSSTSPSFQWNISQKSSLNFPSFSLWVFPSSYKAVLCILIQCYLLTEHLVFLWRTDHVWPGWSASGKMTGFVDGEQWISFFYNFRSAFTIVSNSVICIQVRGFSYGWLEKMIRFRDHTLPRGWQWGIPGLYHLCKWSEGDEVQPASRFQITENLEEPADAIQIRGAIQRDINWLVEWPNQTRTRTNIMWSSAPGKEETQAGEWQSGKQLHWKEGNWWTQR